MGVVFIDTSVLLNILKVPDKAQNVEAVKAQLTSYHQNGSTLLLPITAVIETGNHIAQIKGHKYEKKTCAQKFSDMLGAVSTGDAPWAPNELTWNSTFITRIISGVNTGQRLEHLLEAGRFGAGDLAILAEAQEYKDRSRISKVEIWTLEDEIYSFKDIS